MEAVDLRLLTVVTTALVDAINPCAIGVLILLVTTLLSLSKDRARMLMIGCIYIGAVYVTYFLAGIGLLFFIQKMQIAEPVGLAVGVLVVFLGILEIKDFFFYGQGLSLAISPKHIKRIKRMAKKASIPGAILLGIFVSAVELPCTGGPYLAITTMLAKNFNLQAIYYLLLYNFIFVLPLIIIVALAYFGSSMMKVKKWKTKHKKWMRLVTGIVLVLLGVLLVLYSQGTIDLGAAF